MPPAAFAEVLEARFGGMLVFGEDERVGIANPSDDLEFNVVCDHSRAHTLVYDSM